MLCNRLLLLGFMDGKHALDANDVADVIEDMRQEFAPNLAPVGASIERPEEVQAGPKVKIAGAERNGDI